MVARSSGEMAHLCPVVPNDVCTAEVNGNVECASRCAAGGERSDVIVALQRVLWYISQVSACHGQRTRKRNSLAQFTKG